MILIEETDRRFYIKESTISNAGMGLFASQDIQVGDYLEVIGALVRKGSIADKCTAYASRYKFQASKGDHIVPFGYAGLVNSTDDVEKQNVQLQYLEGLKRRNTNAQDIVYMVIKSIKKDDELLGNYGDEYSKMLRWANERQEIVDRDHIEWEQFLSYNLYDLGQLSSKLQGGR